jgi:hypothetical protein
MAVASWSGPPRSARAAQHASHAGFALRSCGGANDARGRVCGGRTGRRGVSGRAGSVCVRGGWDGEEARCDDGRVRGGGGGEGDGWTRVRRRTRVDAYGGGRAHLAAEFARALAALERGALGPGLARLLRVALARGALLREGMRGERGSGGGESVSARRACRPRRGRDARAGGRVGTGDGAHLRRLLRRRRGRRPLLRGLLPAKVRLGPARLRARRHRGRPRKCATRRIICSVFVLTRIWGNPAPPRPPSVALVPAPRVARSLSPVARSDSWGAPLPPPRRGPGFSCRSRR